MIQTFVRQLLIVIVFLGFSFPSFAAQNQLTEIRIVVSDESQAERERAMQLGLSRVLLRLSGLSVLPDEAAVQTILGQSNRYLLQFGYEQINLARDTRFFEQNYRVWDSAYAQSQQEAASKAGALKLLRLRFDQTMLVKHLQEQGLPVWGDKRPSLMLWWVIEDQGQRRVISDSEQTGMASTGRFSQIRSAFQYGSQLWALPLKLPLMDLQDQQLLSTSDLWGGYPDALREVNQRYQVASYIKGKSFFQNANWHAQWTLNLSGQMFAFETSHPSLFALHQRVIESIATHLGSEYAVVAAEQAVEVLLHINGIGSIGHYAMLEDYFSRLLIVESFHLLFAKEDELVYRMKLKEDADKFARILGLEKKLLPREIEVEANAEPAIAAPLYYRWAVSNR